MTITVHVSDALLQDLATSPEELNREIRLAAAIHLYSRGLISQGKGAEIADLSRWDFIQALGRAEVPACQVSSKELTEEVERAYQAHRQRISVRERDRDHGRLESGWGVTHGCKDGIISAALTIEKIITHKSYEFFNVFSVFRGSKT